MLQHARHLPRGRGNAGNGHDRMPIDFQNFVRTIVNDGIARSRAPIARDQNTPGKLECQNRGRFGGLPCSRLCAVSRHRTDDCGAQQTFASQERRKIVRGARKALVKSQR